MPEISVGLLGARSVVGTPLMAELSAAGYHVTAFTRGAPPNPMDAAVRWRRLPAGSDDRRLLDSVEPQPYWICAAPIWVLPQHFELLATQGARRVVALSSTSRFTKEASSDPEERALASRIATAEDQVCAWASGNGIESVLLRPTLIYGLGQDRNIREIARFIRRFGFFPLIADGHGLRQPVHARDVAAACVAALVTPAAVNRAYELSGAETISYREMVRRVFVALGHPVRFVPVPQALLRVAIGLVRLLPRYRHVSAGMAERMTRDLVFDHDAATRDFGFAPQPFRVTAEDLASGD